MKNCVLVLLSLMYLQNSTIAQQLSVKEFLNLRETPIDTIDSLMKAKKFERSDTTAGALHFRFYGYSKKNNDTPELHYLQLAIQPDDTYAEIQYQTSGKKEASAFQKQLKDSGFVKQNYADSSTIFLLSQDAVTIHYSTEPVTGLDAVLYTFSIRENKSSPGKNYLQKNL